MLPAASEPSLLCLHAVRLLGWADIDAVADRFGQEGEVVEQLLLDFEAAGWVSFSEFAGTAGWSLTERGRAANEQQLARELTDCRGRGVVAQAHLAFLPLNSRFQDAATRWQVRPLPGEPLATNDHTDHRWDDRVIDTITSVGRAITPLCAPLSSTLTRFNGYPERYAASAQRVAIGESRWMDGIGIDSCHAVWMQLHEDLLATLGLERGHEV